LDILHQGDDFAIASLLLSPHSSHSRLGASLISPNDAKWFNRLRRPRWLTFEPLIPVIWTVILICGGISAYFVWEAEMGSFNGWMLMAFYLVLEVAIIAYAPITLRSRNLTLGVGVGLLGFVLGIFLTLSVWQISVWSALLLIPYLLLCYLGDQSSKSISHIILFIINQFIHEIKHGYVNLGMNRI